MPDEPLIPADPEARKRFLAGVLFIGLSVALGYFTIYQPLHDLNAGKATTYSLKGVVLPPVLLYLSALMFLGNFADGEIRRLNEKGKPALTRKGWFVVAGALVVAALTAACWYGYLHSLGVTTE